MLAIQIVNTHDLCLDCYKRAVASINNPVAFKSHMLNFERLSNLHMRQIAALDRHQGQGKQQVRVEHVHVADGGQAIVGKVSLSDSEQRSRRSSRIESSGKPVGRP
jgi:hypothetical protein